MFHHIAIWIIGGGFEEGESQRHDAQKLTTDEDDESSFFSFANSSILSVQVS